MTDPDGTARQNLIRAELLRVDGADPGAWAPSPKHRKMAASPLRFLRGSAQLYYADLANGTLQLPQALLARVPTTAVMGDCHVSNFGFLTEEGSHGDAVVFCPNDYDDACMGHAVWDLARYIASLVLRLGAGTGSVDLERFYLLVGPEDFAGDGDLPLCHVVEVKQQRRASPLYHFPDLRPENRLNPAHLTVDCQRLMQRSPDMVLDEAVWEGKHWLVRSRHHARVGIAPEDVALAKKKPGKGLTAYAGACGEALALAHARGDRRSTRFEAAMARVLAEETDALLDAAGGYAARLIADRQLLKAVMSC